MDSCGVPAPSGFPAGLRVLVADHDPSSLINVDKLLKKCDYKVTTCSLLQKARDLLRDGKDDFDIVMCDVNMPDQDAFEFFDHVALQLGLPVIMTSADDEVSKVIKGIQHGVCDHLQKPIKTREIRNIWQHVVRKRMHSGRNVSLDSAQVNGNLTVQGGCAASTRKRKDMDNKQHDKENSDSSSKKKTRVIWLPELHQKFIEAVNQIGVDKAGPKKILDLMGETSLTRENVASHLQKYRLNLSRNKENEPRASPVLIKPEDIPSQDHTGEFGAFHQSMINQNSPIIQPVVDKSYAVPVHMMHDASVCKGNGSGILQAPIAMKAGNASLSSNFYFNQSFAPLNLEALMVSLKSQFQVEPVFEQRAIPLCNGQVGSASTSCVAPSRGADANRSCVDTFFHVQPESHLANYSVLNANPSPWNRKTLPLEQNSFNQFDFSMRNLSVSGSGQANGSYLPQSDPYLSSYQDGNHLNNSLDFNQDMDNLALIDYDGEEPNW